MNLGAFSVRLSVKDIKASWEFYKKLGFEPIDIYIGRVQTGKWSRANAYDLLGNRIARK